MPKLDPQDVRNLAEDLEDLKGDYAEVLRHEPLIRQPLEDAARIAKKRYADISETKPKESVN